MPRKGQYQEGRFTPAWWDEHTMPEPNTGCFLWLGSTCKEGRGRTSYKGRAGVLIYRIAYECAFGEFDDSLKVCHSCDTPSCVNPDHLFLGTQGQNMHDMFKKGRARPQGRKYLGYGLYEPGPKPVAPRGTYRSRKRPAPVAPIGADANSLTSDVIIGDQIHLIRPVPMVEGWRRVIGVPPVPQHHDGPSCKWPDDKPLDPTYGEDDGYPAVATPAPCCGGAR